MKIASLVLKVLEKDIPALRAGALHVPGLEWQMADAARGRRLRRAARRE